MQMSQTEPDTSVSELGMLPAQTSFIKPACAWLIQIFPSLSSTWLVPLNLKMTNELKFKIFRVQAKFFSSLFYSFYTSQKADSQRQENSKEIKIEKKTGQMAAMAAPYGTLAWVLAAALEIGVEFGMREREWGIQVSGWFYFTLISSTEPGGDFNHSTLASEGIMSLGTPESESSLIHYSWYEGSYSLKSKEKGIVFETEIRRKWRNLHHIFV